MIYNILEMHEGNFVTLCDKELLGIEISHCGNNLKIEQAVYGGKIIDSDFEEKIKNAKHINAIGKKSMQKLQELNLLENHQIIYFKNIPQIHIELK